MKILSITAGAGGMYCGSCLRDNALAAELVARGHDVTLLPLYTPLRTDEPDVSRSTVLFGGISVYLQQHSKLFRRTPRFIDRLLDSPRLIRAFADRSVSTDPRLLGELTISMLEGTAGVLRKEFDKLLDWLAGEPKPDAVNITNSMLIGLARPLREALGRPICCTLQGEDLFLRFVAVSEYYASFMATYLQIPEDRMSVVPIGINMAGFDRGKTSTDDVFRIGYFARIAPEKGLHILAAAFQRFRQRVDGHARLEIGGYLAASHKGYLAGIQRSLKQAGLSDDVAYRGEVDRAGKIAFLRELDVLSVPATYDEPKGVFLLEAMACGVPVVQPRRGAFTEVVEKTGGGLLVRADDVEGLAEGLFTLWRDRTLRDELGRRGHEGVRAHYTIQHSVDRLTDVFEGVCRTGLRALTGA